MKEAMQKYTDAVMEMVDSLEGLPESYKARLIKRANDLLEAFRVNWETAEKKRKKSDELIQRLDDAIEGEVDTPEEIAIVREAMPEIVEAAKDEKVRGRLSTILKTVGHFLFDPSEVRR